MRKRDRKESKKKGIGGKWSPVRRPVDYLGNNFAPTMAFPWAPSETGFTD